jgi:hypothetical protein
VPDEFAPVSESFPFEFRALVVRELEAIGLGIKEWRDGGLAVEREDGTEQFLGLANLFRRVSAGPQEAAAEVVRDFIQQSHAGKPAELAEQMPSTMEEASDRLLVRISRPFEADEKAPWSTTVLGIDDLAISLVIDFPTMMAFVSEEMLARSSTPTVEWLYLGLLNLQNRTPEDWLRLLHAEEGIWCGHADDSYDAARALVLCDLTDCDDLGWLMAIPTRDWLFARKVEPAGVPYFHLLKVIARNVIAEQPYPISDDVYWVRPGKPWERFRIDLEENQVTVYPPAEFAEALNIPVEDGPTGVTS